MDDGGTCAQRLAMQRTPCMSSFMHQRPARPPQRRLHPSLSHAHAQGTLNLIAAARQKGVKQFIFVTSIGADDLANPLNLFWGVLFWKKRSEEELQRSGLTYTIVRPGGAVCMVMMGGGRTIRKGMRQE